MIENISVIGEAYFPGKHAIDIEGCMRNVKFILRTPSYYPDIFSGVTIFIPPVRYTSDLSAN